MENDDPRRQQANEDPRRHSQNEDRGRDRWSLRPDDERGGRRAGGEESGWLDYDRNYGRSDEQRYGDRGGRQEQRYGQGSSERSSFSPDWSREGAEPRYSDDPYYSRNRNEPSQGWRGDDDRSRWEQRSRQSIPREQRELAERSRSGDYYSPDWPYERSGQGRDMQRSRDDDQNSHYRGYYSRSTTPFAYPGGQGYLYSESITLHGPYTGRGPKGYRRSDQQLIEEASQRLERDGDIDASDIEVTAEDGVITLRGTVPDRRTKRRAEECVESVYGARDVMNELRCGMQGGEQSQGSQGSQASQRAQGTRGSQTSQTSQSSQSSPSTSRGSTSASGMEQSGEDKKPPKH
jgi:hypothetical protein